VRGLLPPSPALVSTLGVLRRPAGRPTDRLSSQWLAGEGQVYAGSVRHMLTARGVSYHVWATRGVLTGSVPSDRCFALETHRASLAMNAGSVPRGGTRSAKYG
jgi:hypothetical protein